MLTVILLPLISDWLPICLMSIFHFKEVQMENKIHNNMQALQAVDNTLSEGSSTVLVNLKGSTDQVVRPNDVATNSSDREGFNGTGSMVEFEPSSKQHPSLRESMNMLNKAFERMNPTWNSTQREASSRLSFEDKGRTTRLSGDLRPTYAQVQRNKSKTDYEPFDE